MKNYKDEFEISKDIELPQFTKEEPKQKGLEIPEFIKSDPFTSDIEKTPEQPEFIKRDNRTLMERTIAFRKSNSLEDTIDYFKQEAQKELNVAKQKVDKEGEKLDDTLSDLSNYEMTPEINHDLSKATNQIRNRDKIVNNISNNIDNIEDSTESQLEAERRRVLESQKRRERERDNSIQFQKSGRTGKPTIASIRAESRRRQEEREKEREIELERTRAKSKFYLGNAGFESALFQEMQQVQNQINDFQNTCSINNVVGIVMSGQSGRQNGLNEEEKNNLKESLKTTPINPKPRK